MAKLKFASRLGRRHRKGYVYYWSMKDKTKLVRYSNYFGVTTFDGYMFVDKSQRWEHIDTATGNRGSHYPRKVRSVRAFRRLLRKWSEYLPPGIEFILCSRFEELEVRGKTTVPKSRRFNKAA